MKVLDAMARISDIARIGNIPEWRVEQILREAEQEAKLTQSILQKGQ